MTQFFRKIRRQFLQKNRFNKYLVYATGEVILVVIGILIALQVNNWNELRKTKTIEVKTLKELRSDLLQNIRDIDINISNLNTCKKANETVLYYSKNKLPFNDSLKFHFANLYPFITFSPVQTTYNQLKQTGINLIANDSLKVKISELYSERFNAYRNFENIYMIEHYTNYVKPMFIAEFKSYQIYESFQSLNYNRFIQNKDYRQVMDFTIENCRRFIIIQSNLKKMVEDLIRDIDTEIALYEN